MTIATYLVTLACATGFQLVDWSARLPVEYSDVTLIIDVDPFYTRITIYPLERPEAFQPCCGNKPSSFITLPRGSGKFCIRQSQPRMKWKMRVVPLKQRVII